ncbi:MAG: hypothetical protein Q9P14_15715 [candidate division KSB1 bacterium]|nr:hypothetical protein [candidate division KSB1 bacterium]MDQ7063275.1 hypothetical protein [candidate division KSB1 bacterium]
MIQKHEQFRLLMMKALDGELSPQEETEFQQFLQEKAFRREWLEFKQLKEVTQGMKFKYPPQEVWDSYWMNVYNRLERGLAWILLSIGAIIFLSYGLYQLFHVVVNGSELPLLLRVAIVALVIGTAILLVSVIREKLFVRKRDPYKEVQQ